MPARIEDYAIIGDTRTVGLVDGSGSIDWWCAPRIDSGAAFAALLGTKHNGRWLIAPEHDVTAVSRRYEAETLDLETVFETSTGRASSARSWSGCCTSRPTRYSPSRDRPDETSLGAPGNARPAGCACG